MREAVLELTYTAHDMAPLAADLGHIDEPGEVRPPFLWDPERRLHLCAKLDALFFHLYGITDRDDVRYVWSTFPIVERQDVVRSVRCSAPVRPRALHGQRLVQSLPDGRRRAGVVVLQPTRPAA